jgi:hypothetical protein
MRVEGSLRVPEARCARRRSAGCSGTRDTSRGKQCLRRGPAAKYPRFTYAEYKDRNLARDSADSVGLDTY